MEILYVSKLCSKKKFEEIFAKCRVKPQQQAQKFHQLLVTGLAGQEGVHITALSGLPISRLHSKKIWWKADSEVENGTTYRYLSHLNMPLFGQIVAFISAFFETVNWILRNSKKEKHIVCDALNLTIALAAKTAAFLFKVKRLAIVTDIPGFMRDYKIKYNSSWVVSLYTNLCNFTLQRYDAYVVLTEQMNILVNPKNRPKIVVEGMVDKVSGYHNHLGTKHPGKVMMYAGALYEKYGVKTLLEAFLLIPPFDSELWLFGWGELDVEIKKIEEKHKQVKFFGVVFNKEVMEKEVSATLLVNPRPSSEEFTKYSFPSKIMEYMASGTPVLTTRLPGMPAEYFEFVYLFDDESPTGMAKTLERVLTLPKEELHAKGAAAREFVLREKNNFVQAKKILSLIEEVVCLR